MRQVLIGWTAAHQAVFGNDPVCLRMFCDANASLACPDKDGLTPGHLAAQWGNVQCVSVLRHAGVLFGLPDNQGCKPKDVAVLYKQKSAVDFLVAYCGRACQAKHGLLGFQMRACVQRATCDVYPWIRFLFLVAIKNR